MVEKVSSSDWILIGFHMCFAAEFETKETEIADSR